MFNNILNRKKSRYRDTIVVHTRNKSIINLEYGYHHHTNVFKISSRVRSELNYRNWNTHASQSCDVSMDIIRRCVLSQTLSLSVLLLIGEIFTRCHHLSLCSHTFLVFQSVLTVKIKQHTYKQTTTSASPSKQYLKLFKHLQIIFSYQ